MVVADAPDVRAISRARVKSDRFDARTLARPPAAGMLDAVWFPHPATQTLRRRVARRAAKNEVHAVLSRCLLGRSPATDLFGVGGRAWLAVQTFPESEAGTGAQVAAVAVARKIACLCWQLLTNEEDYASARLSLMRAKNRRAELDAGAPRSTRHGGRPAQRSGLPGASWPSESPILSRRIDLGRRGDVRPHGIEMNHLELERLAANLVPG